MLAAAGLDPLPHISGGWLLMCNVKLSSPYFTQVTSQPGEHGGVTSVPQLPSRASHAGDTRCLQALSLQ